MADERAVRLLPDVGRFNRFGEIRESIVINGNHFTSVSHGRRKRERNWFRPIDLVPATIWRRRRRNARYLWDVYRQEHEGPQPFVSTTSRYL